MLQVKSRRRPNPLYGARIHGKPLRYLAHALSAPGRLQSGQDSSFQFRRYARATKLLALALGPSAQAGTADQKNREWIGTAHNGLAFIWHFAMQNISTDGGSGPAP